MSGLFGSSLETHAPSVQITGSYFPSWMAFLLIGIALTLVIRVILIRIGIDDYMPARVVAYSALSLAITYALLLLNVPL